MISYILYSYDQEEVMIFGLGPISQNSLTPIIERIQVTSLAPSKNLK